MPVSANLEAGEVIEADVAMGHQNKEQGFELKG
jgi:hypothetical protein